MNDQVKYIAEENTRLTLALNTTLQENSSIKNELISLKIKQTDYEDKIKKSCENDQKTEQLVKKFNFQVENWKYKFKCLEQKISDLESIEKQTRAMADSLICENQSLRSVVMHHDCEVKKLTSENDRLKKEFEEKIEHLNSQNEKLLNFKSDSDLKVDYLNGELLKTKDLWEKVKSENEKILSEKLEIELKLISNHQNLINIKNNCQSSEQSLEEKNQEIKKIQEEKNTLNMELNNLKISSEYEINELKKQIKKLDLTLKCELDEKNLFKNQLDEKVEQIYLTQLNNKELSESLKKYQDKKSIDNFTQTIFMLKNLCLINKSTQTIMQNGPSVSSSFTQTPMVLNRAISTQTQIVSFRHISTETDNFLNFNKNLGFKKDWSLSSLNYDLDDSYRENFRPKIYHKNENAKSLFEGMSKKATKRVRFSDLNE